MAHLPAVHNNRLFINDFDTWYSYDLLAISGQIDLAVELLTQRDVETAKQKSQKPEIS